MYHKNMGPPALAFPHFRLTRLLEGDLNDQFPDLKESVVDVEVDELEEDLG